MSLKLRNTVHYDTGEVSCIINRCIKTTQGRLKAGLIRSEKIKGKYFVAHEDLVTYLNEELALPESIIALRLHKKPVRSACEG